MQYNPFASTYFATSGTYNDVAVDQTNNTFQGPVTVQTNSLFNQDSNVHGALIRELRDRLNPSDFFGDDQPHCLEGTREQVLQSIDEWVNSTGYPNVLLLIGAVGTGKSTIATTVAEKYQRSKRLGCHIFFVRGRSDPGDVLESIAYYLAVYSQTIAESLVKQLKGSGNLGPSNLKTKFDILLRDTLSAVAANVDSPIVIILDALDEYGTPETRQSLFNVLRDCLPTLPANFRILITSRPDEDISPLISSPSYKIITLDQHSDESKLNIYTYIKHQFDQMRSSGKLTVPDDYEWDKSIQTLADSADGLFIWASTAVRLVSEERQLRYNCFQNLVSNANLLDLGELYNTVLVRALEWNEENKEIFKNIFSLILFSKRPLSDEEITGFLGIDMDVTSNILSHLRSLVRYESGNPINIRHTSFYDYLVSCKEMPWYIDADEQKVYIASKCLERMGDSLRYNICNIPSSSIFNTDIPGIENLVSRYIPPFLKYICSYWAHHLQDVSYSQKLCSQLRSFAHHQLLFWFEVLSLTDTFNDHVGPALLFAIDWVGKNDPELSFFLRDAHLQASAYSEPISKSVLQIYTSLLPLTKEESPMSMHYAEYASTGCRIEYIGRKRRNDCIKTIRVGDIYTPIDFLLFSPDGMRILSNSMRGLCVWDVTSGELIAGPLAGNDDSSVLSAAYSLDGKCIISVSRSGIITKWDIFTGRLVWEREIDKSQIDLSQVVSAVFSPNMTSIVLGNDKGIIGIWDVDTGMQDGELLWGCIGFINCLSFSSDGQYLASRSNDTTITILDMDRREIVFSPFRRRTRRVTAPNVSPSGNGIVSGSVDGAILLWSACTGEILRKIKCENEVYSVAHSPDGRVILAGGYGWMNMWNVVDARAGPKVFQVYGDIRLLSFSPDGSRFAFTNRRDEIHIWDAPWSVEETNSGPE